MKKIVCILMTLALLLGAFTMCASAEDVSAPCVEDINVEVTATNATINVVIDEQVTNVTFTQGDNSTVVTEAAALCQSYVYSFTTESSDSVTFVVNNDTVALDPVTCQLTRFAAGKYVIYTDLYFGDANLDGATNIKDLVRIKRILGDILPATDMDFADINGNAAIDNGDLTLLAKYILTAKTGMKGCTVTFNNAAGTAIAQMTIPEGFGLPAGTVPAVEETYEGKEFVGWDKNFSNIVVDTVFTPIYSNDITGQIPSDWPYDPAE